MKRREPPKVASYDLHPRLKNDPQVKKWTQRLLGDSEARPTDLTEDQLAFVFAEVMRERGEEFSPSYFKEAMIKTRPRSVAPDWTDDVEDLTHIFSQPEVQDFWRRWDGITKAKGPKPDYAPSKAVMAVMGMAGSGKHLDTIVEHLGRDPQVLAIFEALEGRDLAVRPYSTTDRHMKLLAESCVLVAQEANIACVKALRALDPTGGYGERLILDSSDVPAWCKQVGNRNADQDKKLRRRTPEAGFRRYQHTSNGKRTIKQGEKITVGSGKLPTEWRGYYFTVIADQASGLPLVWMLFDAANDEAPAIVPLLSRLYRLWPDCPAKLIAGDSAWDEKEWNRLCETDYGIAPIFRIHESEIGKPWIVLDKDASRDGSVVAITREGQLVCAAHKKALPFDSFDAPSRAGLAAGKTNDEGQFRVRASCNHNTPGAPPCGRIGLRAKTNWHRLTRYPHYSSGHPRRHAMRQAMLIRLNGVEAIFNRLKGGKLLGSKSADRTRFLDRATVEALLSLACLSMSALSLASERQQRGLSPVAVTAAGVQASSGAGPGTSATGSQSTPSTQPQAPAGAPTAAPQPGSVTPITPKASKGRKTVAASGSAGVGLDFDLDPLLIRRIGIG